MIIMQTEDAKKRRDHIKSKDLAKVVFEHEHGDAVCVQYHPKGIRGRFSPWFGTRHRRRPNTESCRWHDARTRQPRVRAEQPYPSQITLLSMARMRPGSQGLLSRDEA